MITELLEYIRDRINDYSYGYRDTEFNRGAITALDDMRDFVKYLEMRYDKNNYNDDTWYKNFNKIVIELPGRFRGYEWIR